MGEVVVAGGVTREASRRAASTSAVASSGLALVHPDDVANIFFRLFSARPAEWSVTIAGPEAALEDTANRTCRMRAAGL